MKKRKIKMNENKSAHIIFIVKNLSCIHNNNLKIPQTQTVRHLKLQLDRYLTWHHIEKEKSRNIDKRSTETNKKKMNPDIQSNHQTNIGLWTRTMGKCIQIKCRNN